MLIPAVLLAPIERYLAMDRPSQQTLAVWIQYNYFVYLCNPLVSSSLQAISVDLST